MAVMSRPSRMAMVMVILMVQRRLVWPSPAGELVCGVCGTPEVCGTLAAVAAAAAGEHNRSHGQVEARPAAAAYRHRSGAAMWLLLLQAGQHAGVHHCLLVEVGHDALLRLLVDVGSHGVVCHIEMTLLG